MRALMSAVLAAFAATAAVPGEAAETRALAVIGQIPAPDGDWDQASFDAETGRLFVARGVGVLALDLPSRKITAALVPGSKVHAVVLLPGGEILVTSGGSNSAILADGRDGHIKARIPTGRGPESAAFDPASGLVLVADTEAADISVIDPKAQSVVGHIPLDGPPGGLAVTGSGEVFAVVREPAEIARIDIKAREVKSRFELQNCRQPSGLAYAPTHEILLVACENQVAKAVAAQDGRSLAEVPVGSRAGTALFDDMRGLGFVACGDGTLAVIRMDGPRDITLVQTLATAEGARTAALDAKTGRLYLPAGKTAAAGRNSRSAAPQAGRFGILIVGPPERM